MRWTLAFLEQYTYKLSVHEPRVWLSAILVVVAAAALGSLAPVLRPHESIPSRALRVE